MKLMIASDIHGSAYWCRKLLAAFGQEGADRLLLLGDILYHGPRNDLPRDYAPKEVLAMLNDSKDRILCIRGNCDTEVDQMVLEFPILADYCVIPIGNHLLYATHGHNYNPKKPVPLADGDLLLYGHTHVPLSKTFQTEDGACFHALNPGSVSIPKEESAHSYMILEDGVFTWKSLDGEGNVNMEYITEE